MAQPPPALPVPDPAAGVVAVYNTEWALQVARETFPEEQLQEVIRPESCPPMRFGDVVTQVIDQTSQQTVEGLVPYLRAMDAHLINTMMSNIGAFFSHYVARQGAMHEDTRQFLGALAHNMQNTEKALRDSKEHVDQAALTVAQNVAGYGNLIMSTLQYHRRGLSPSSMTHRP